MINRINIAIAIFAIFLLLQSCGDKNKTKPEPPKETKYSNLQITVSPQFNKKYFRLPEYKDTLVGGRKINVTKAQMYFSDFTLTTLTGADRLFDGIVLYKPGKTTYTVSTSVIVDDYNNTKFLVGLNNAVSEKSPDYHAALNDSSMWFKGTPGDKPIYAFLVVEGLVDTTANATGEANVPFNYTLGTQTMLTQIDLGFEGATSICENIDNFVNINIDFARLFDGIDFSKEEQRIIDSPSKNLSNGHYVKNNISKMISVSK